MALRKICFVLASACAYMVSVKQTSSSSIAACDPARWTTSSPSFHAPEIVDPYSRQYDDLPSIRPVALHEVLSRIRESDAIIQASTRSLPRTRLRDRPLRILQHAKSFDFHTHLNLDILFFLVLLARRALGATRPWLAAPAELAKAALLHTAIRMRPPLGDHRLDKFDDALASILLTVVIDTLGGALMAAWALHRNPSFAPRRRSMWARLVTLTRRVLVNWASSLLNFRSRVSTLASRLFNLNELLLWSFVLAAFELGPMCFSYEVGFAGLVWLFLSVLVRFSYGRFYPSASPPGPKPCRDKKRYKRASKAKKKTAKAGAA